MTPQNIALYCFVLISAIILCFAFLVLWKIYRNEISIAGLLDEQVGPGEPRKASLSRLQFLIFTFVIAGLFLLLSIEAGTFVQVPTNVLALLGISGGSYIASKAMTNSRLPPARPAPRNAPRTTEDKVGT